MRKARVSVQEGDTVPCPPDICLWWTEGQTRCTHLLPLALQSFAEAGGAGGLWRSLLVAKMQHCQTSARSGVLTGGGFGVIKATGFVVIRARSSSVRGRHPPSAGGWWTTDGYHGSGVWASAMGCRCCQGPRRALSGSQVAVFWLCLHVAGSQVSRDSSKGKSRHGGPTP